MPQKYHEYQTLRRNPTKIPEMPEYIQEIQRTELQYTRVQTTGNNNNTNTPNQYRNYKPNTEYKEEYSRNTEN